MTAYNRASSPRSPQLPFRGGLSLRGTPEFDGLRRQDHRRFVLAPGLLRLHHIIANGLVLDEEPRFVEQEHLEGGEVPRVGNFIRCPVQNVKEEWFQDLRRI